MHLTKDKYISDTLFPFHFISSKSKPASLNKSFFTQFDTGGEKRTEQTKYEHLHQNSHPKQKEKYSIRSILNIHKYHQCKEKQEPYN